MTTGDRLLFRAGGQQFTLAADRVREVARLHRLTPVPLAPPELLGLANIGGETVAVLSAAQAQAAGERSAGPLLLLAGTGGIAIMVDAVERLTRSPGDIMDLPVDDLIARAFPDDQHIRRQSGATVSRATHAASHEERLALLRFVIGDQSFALPLEEVAEVLRVPRDIAKLPGADGAVVGSICWQDMTLGIVSLAVLLGFTDHQGSAPRHRQGRIVVVALGGHRLGLLVDGIEGIARVPPSRIDSIPATLLRGESEARIRAIYRPEEGGRLVSILASDELLSEPRTRALLASGRSDSAPATPSVTAEHVSLLPARFGGYTIAFPVGALEKVIARPAMITPLPAAPAWLLGLAALDGEPLPIIDQVLRLTGSPATGRRQRLLVLRVVRQRIGFLADEARSILTANTALIAPAPLPPDLAHGIFGDVLQHGEADETMLVIDPAALFSSAERELLAEAASLALSEAP